MLGAVACAGASELELQNLPKPVPGPGEAVVRVHAAGITPGLLTWWERGRIPTLPAVIGHEIAGVVDHVGPGVIGFEPGSRVTVHCNLSCRRCEQCLDDREQMCEYCAMLGAAAFGPRAKGLWDRYANGGLAEYVLVPDWLLDPLPDAVSFDLGAKVHDLSTSLRAVKLAQLRPGATVAVTAATGAMGASLMRVLPLLGVGRVLLVARSRARAQEVAALCAAPTGIIALEELDGWEESGALTEAVRTAIPGDLDAIIDYFASGPGLMQVMAALRVGGTTVTMAPNMAPLSIVARDVMSNCWTLVGTRNGTRSDHHQIIELLASGRLQAEDLITQRFPLSQVNDAVRSVRERTAQPAWMCVVNPIEVAA